MVRSWRRVFAVLVACTSLASCSPPQRDVNHISDEDASPERLLHRRQVFNATGWDPIYDNNTACPGSRWPIQVVRPKILAEHNANRMEDRLAYGHAV